MNGSQGPMGLQGPQGPRGPRGPPGSNGSSISVTGANLYENCIQSNSSCTNTTSVLSCVTPSMPLPVSCYPTKNILAIKNSI